MRNLDNYLKYKEIDFKKLLEYGFVKEKDEYIYKTKILDNQFEVIVIISNAKKTSSLIDLANEEEYILVDIQDSVGEYVGKLREEYEKVLQSIFSDCTNPDIFKSEQAKQIIEYVKDKYDCKLEFLWDTSPDAAIWRNKSNNKWFGLLITITEDKLNINSNKEVVALDLKYQKNETNSVIDNKKVFPGYHMNKKSWITIKLDNTMGTEEIYRFIDNSYELSIGNKCKLAGNELSQKIYDYLTAIPKGKVVTYGQIAEFLGNKGLSRAVGSALHRNPDGDKYPCYKVLNAKGELAEAFVFGGKSIQKKLLEKDGIKVINYKVDLEKYQWKK